MFGNKLVPNRVFEKYSYLKGLIVLISKTYVRTYVFICMYDNSEFPLNFIQPSTEEN